MDLSYRFHLIPLKPVDPLLFRHHELCWFHLGSQATKPVVNAHGTRIDLCPSDDRPMEERAVLESYG